MAQNRDDDEQDGDEGAAVAHQHERGPDASQHGQRHNAQRQDDPALTPLAPSVRQIEEGDQELEVEIGGDYDQLKKQGGVEKLVNPRGDSGDFNEGKRRLGQLMERQPEILSVPLLGEIQSKKKDGQDGKEEGDN